MTGYTPRDAQFHCRLGELTLLRSERRLQVCNLGPAVVRGEPTAAVEAELGRAALQAGADGVLLRSMPQPPAGRLRLRNGRIHYIPRRYKRRFIRLAGRGFDDYLAGFSARSRSSLKRKLRKFEQASGGPLDFRQYRTAAELEEFYVRARDVSRHTYQELMFDMGLPADPAFREHMLRAAAQDLVRAYLLFLHGRPVAYLYCPCVDGVVEYQYLGYLQDCRQLSPGTVLLLCALEALFDDPGAEFFDFTEGGKEGGHKDFFADDSRDCADVYILRPSPANAWLVLSQTLCDQVSKHAGRLLERLHLKRRIKAALRLVKGGAAA